MTEDGESYEITPWAAHIGRWAIYVRPSNDRGNAVDSFHHADDLQEPDKLELRADGRVFFTTEREYIEALPVNALPPTQVRNCHSSAKILGRPRAVLSALDQLHPDVPERLPIRRRFDTDDEASSRWIHAERCGPSSDAVALWSVGVATTTPRASGR